MKPKFSYREIVRLTVAGGYTQREIAAAANCATGTVSNVQKRLRSSGIDGDTALSMGEGELRGLLGSGKGRVADERYVQPDFASIDEQLSQHRGPTLTIHGEEYAKRCADAGKQAYMYSFFSQRYREWRSASDLSLKVTHVPGDKMEVDWAGTTMEYVDRFTGEVCTRSSLAPRCTSSRRPRRSTRTCRTFRSSASTLTRWWSRRRPAGSLAGCS